MNEAIKAWHLSLRDAGFQPDESNTVWKGKVSVAWSDTVSGEQHTAEHHVGIWLRPGFPYHAPAVFCLDDPPLQPSWHMYAGKPATLCLWDAERGWDPSFSARKLVKRIIDWFYYHHTDSWPPNSQVPDLHAYLESIGVVLIGDEWKPSIGETTGRFNLWYSANFRNRFPDVASTSPGQEKPESRIADNTLLDSSSVMTSGVWFRVPSPFVPVKRLDDLLTIIDELVQEPLGWAGTQLKRTFGTKAGGEGMPIAIGYCDNQGHERWLFLWAELPERDGKRYKWQTSRNIRQITVKSLQTAPAARNDLLRRSAYFSQNLTDKRVTVFGVGALGSSIALLLAKSGVGHLHLVDGDRLMPGNVMRHECGLQYVGDDKTYALQRTINGHNPDCVVQRFEATWEPDGLRSYIADTDIVVDATGNTNFSLHLNDICVRHNHPIIFTAAYRRATVGRVIARTGKDDPCLSCYLGDLSAWSDDQFLVIPRNPDEHFIEDGCGSITEEAVALDVEAVANFSARWIVKILLGEHDGYNLAMCVNEGLTDAETHALLQQPGTILRANSPRSDCPVCG